jgi:hypothetical protein
VERRESRKRERKKAKEKRKVEVASREPQKDYPPQACALLRSLAFFFFLPTTMALSLARAPAATSR